MDSAASALKDGQASIALCLYAGLNASMARVSILTPAFVKRDGKATYVISACVTIARMASAVALNFASVFTAMRASIVTFLSVSRHA